MLTLGRQNKLREQLRTMRPSWRPATEVFADTVRAHLTPDARVLDLGCGRGGLIEQLTHPLAQVLGIDPDFESLIEHRVNLSRVQGLHPLPFADQSFDVIYASWVLEHWAEPQRELREIKRVLKPSGVFVFITPNVYHPLLWANYALAQTQLQDALVEFFYGRDETDTFAIHYRANTPRQLNSLSHQLDLPLTTLHLVNDPTYIAFTPWLFRAAVWSDRLLPQHAAIHLVGVFRKKSDGAAD